MIRIFWKFLILEIILLDRISREMVIFQCISNLSNFAKSVDCFEYLNCFKWFYCFNLPQISKFSNVFHFVIYFANSKLIYIILTVPNKSNTLNFAVNDLNVPNNSNISYIWNLCVFSNDLILTNDSKCFDW